MQCSCNFLFISCSYLEVYVDERPLWLYVCMTRLVKRNYLVPTFSHYLSDSQSNKHEYICRGLHTPHSILMLDYLLCFNM